VWLIPVGEMVLESECERLGRRFDGSTISAFDKQWMKLRLGGWGSLLQVKGICSSLIKPLISLMKNQSLSIQKRWLNGEVSAVLLPLALSSSFTEAALPKFVKLAFTLS
jgi:hypothetical protein